MMPGGKHNCAFHCAVRQHKLAQPGSIRLLQKGHPEFSYAPWQNLYFFPLPHQQRSLRPILRGDPAPLEPPFAAVPGPSVRRVPSDELSMTLRTRV
jgi:hypothetical protein